MNKDIVMHKRNKYNMYVRPCSSDDFTLDESEVYNDLFINANSDDILLDLGSNIGSTIMVAKQNVPDIEVIGFEPCDESHAVLLKNIAQFDNVKIIKAAVGKGNDSVKFYENLGGSNSKNSIIRDEFDGNDVNSYQVHKLDFSEQLEKYKPTLLKIDIEGGELDLDLSDLDERIKGVAIEFHIFNQNYYKILELYLELKDQFGFMTGEILEEEDVYYMEDRFPQDYVGFMVTFLRNEKLI